ncbi:MAG: hypothetical protein ABIR55_00335 [Burkholderiaceae bacterium]
MYRAVERRVLDHDLHSNGERLVTKRQADALIKGGLYRSSTGSPASALHWRRSLSDGSCLHLVVQMRQRRLHHDTYDPHASLLSLGLHMTHEARSEAAAMAALAWSAVNLLAK